MANPNHNAMDFAGLELRCEEVTASTSIVAPTITATTSLVLGAETLVAADLTLLNAITATAVELNYNAAVTPGTVAASKTVIVDANKDVSEFRNLTATNVIVGVGGSINSDSGTATAAAGAATLSKMAGKVTTEALVTAAQASYTLTLTNTAVAAADLVFVSVANGTNAAGRPVVNTVTPAAGSCVILIGNEDAAAAFNGTLVISFLVVKA